MTPADILNHLQAQFTDPRLQALAAGVVHSSIVTAAQAAAGIDTTEQEKHIRSQVAGLTAIQACHARDAAMAILDVVFDRLLPVPKQ